MTIDEVLFKKSGEKIYRHKISGVPGFEGALFTKEYTPEFGNENWLTLENTLKFTSRAHSVLPSVRELAAYAIAQHNPRARAAEEYLRVEQSPPFTRTSALYFENDGKIYVAIDDSPNPQNNLILSHHAEGYRQEVPYDCEEDGSTGPLRRWKLNKNDRLTQTLLKRAEKHDRIIPVPARNELPLALTIHSGKSSAFERDPVIRAILGDITAPFADMLRKKAAKKTEYLQTGHAEGWLYYGKELPDYFGTRLVTADFGTSTKAMRLSEKEAKECMLVRCVTLHQGIYADWSCVNTGTVRGIYNPTEWRPAAKR